MRFYGGVSPELIEEARRQALEEALREPPLEPYMLWPEVDIMFHPEWWPYRGRWLPEVIGPEGWQHIETFPPFPEPMFRPERLRRERERWQGR